MYVLYDQTVSSQKYRIIPADRHTLLVTIAWVSGLFREGRVGFWCGGKVWNDIRGHWGKSGALGKSWGIRAPDTLLYPSLPKKAWYPYPLWSIEIIPMLWSPNSSPVPLILFHTLLSLKSNPSLPKKAWYSGYSYQGYLSIATDPTHWHSVACQWTHVWTNVDLWYWFMWDVCNLCVF